MALFLSMPTHYFTVIAAGINKNKAKLSFTDFIAIFWNFLSLDASLLPSMAYYLFDDDRSDSLDYTEIRKLVELIHQKNYYTHPMIRSMVDSIQYEHAQISQAQFRALCKKNHNICAPIAGMQFNLRKKLGGDLFWRRMSLKREEGDKSMSTISFVYQCLRDCEETRAKRERELKLSAVEERRKKRSKGKGKRVDPNHDGAADANGAVDRDYRRRNATGAREGDTEGKRGSGTSTCTNTSKRGSGTSTCTNSSKRGSGTSTGTNTSKRGSGTSTGTNTSKRGSGTSTGTSGSEFSSKLPLRRNSSKIFTETGDNDTDGGRGGNGGGAKLTRGQSQKSLIDGADGAKLMKRKVCLCIFHLFHTLSLLFQPFASFSEFKDARVRHAR